MALIKMRLVCVFICGPVVPFDVEPGQLAQLMVPVLSLYWTNSLQSNPTDEDRNPFLYSVVGGGDHSCLGLGI